MTSRGNPLRAAPILLLTLLKDEERLVAEPVEGKSTRDDILDSFNEAHDAPDPNVSVAEVSGRKN